MFKKRIKKLNGRSESSKSTNLKILRATNSNDIKREIYLEVNKISTKGLLDSSATISCVSENFLNAIKSNIKKEKVKCNTKITAGNSEKVLIQNRVKLNIEKMGIFFLYCAKFTSKYFNTF